MELSWTMKLRIAAAAAAGVVLIGILGWQMTEPAVTTGSVGLRGAVTLVILALIAGFIGYFVSWPHGHQIGILAAPFGLAVWAVRSGSMASLIQVHPTAAQRLELITSLKWEPITWLVIVAAGCAGPLLCWKVVSKKKTSKKKERSKVNPIKYLNAITALAASGVMAQFFLRVFAQDVSLMGTIGEKQISVLAQPATGQIVFAVFASFGLAAFVVKKFLDVSYIWPIISTFFVTIFALGVYAKNVSYLAGYWPAAFFPNAIVSVLPVEMVAFGTLGSVAGYWMAIRFDFWRKHEI
ncbi:MAG: hypothetical protein A2Z25_06440 [Planctomycetes bacterium RBG_16_55_9]|nr:MAG: hypothetical protein A2Z25_06440 [Planctomycetes bacterium RBG_16_55_9]